MKSGCSQKNTSRTSHIDPNFERRSHFLVAYELRELRRVRQFLPQKWKRTISQLRTPVASQVFLEESKCNSFLTRKRSAALHWKSPAACGMSTFFEHLRMPKAQSLVELKNHRRSSQWEFQNPNFWRYLPYIRPISFPLIIQIWQRTETDLKHLRNQCPNDLVYEFAAPEKNRRCLER